MTRPRLAVASLVGFAAFVSCLSAARAEPPAAPKDSEKTDADSASPLRSGFEVLASVGYGAPTSDLVNLEISPYGATFGLDVGFVVRSGFRAGATVIYGLGRTIPQRRQSRFGDDVDLEVDASSLNVGLSLGYDVPLYFLVLRSQLVFGGTFMRWDLGAPPNSILGDTQGSPSSGFFLAPGLALFWPRRVFEWGVGFDYFAQANGAIPPGFLGKLVMGAKF